MEQTRRSYRWMMIAADSSMLVGTFLTHAALFREVSTAGAGILNQAFCLLCSALSLAAFFCCLSAPKAYFSLRIWMLFSYRALKLVTCLWLSQTGGSPAASSTGLVASLPWITAALVVLFTTTPLRKPKRAPRPPSDAPPGLLTELSACSVNLLLLAALLAWSQSTSALAPHDPPAQWLCNAMNSAMHCVEVFLLCIPQDAKYFDAACTTRPTWLLITYLDVYLGFVVPALISARLHLLRKQHLAADEQQAAAVAAQQQQGSSKAASSSDAPPPPAPSPPPKNAFQQLLDVVALFLGAVLLWVVAVHLHMYLKTAYDRNMLHAPA